MQIGIHLSTCSHTEMIFSTITFCDVFSRLQDWHIALITHSTVRAYEQRVGIEGDGRERMRDGEREGEDEGWREGGSEVGSEGGRNGEWK